MFWRKFEKKKENQKELFLHKTVIKISWGLLNRK